MASTRPSSCRQSRPSTLLCQRSKSPGTRATTRERRSRNAASVAAGADRTGGLVRPRPTAPAGSCTATARHHRLRCAGPYLVERRTHGGPDQGRVEAGGSRPEWDRCTHPARSRRRRPAGTRPGHYRIDKNDSNAGMLRALLMREHLRHWNFPGGPVQARHFSSLVDAWALRLVTGVRQIRGADDEKVTRAAVSASLVGAIVLGIDGARRVASTLNCSAPCSKRARASAVPRTLNSVRVSGVTWPQLSSRLVPPWSPACEQSEARPRALARCNSSMSTGYCRMSRPLELSQL